MSFYNSQVSLKDYWAHVFCETGWLALLLECNLNTRGTNGGYFYLRDGPGDFQKSLYKSRSPKPDSLVLYINVLYRTSSRGTTSGTFSWLRGCDTKTSCVSSLQKNMEATWRRSCGLSQSFMRGWEHVYSYTSIYIHIHLYIDGANSWWGTGAAMLTWTLFHILAEAFIYLNKRRWQLFIKDGILLLTAALQCPVCL